MPMSRPVGRNVRVRYLSLYFLVESSVRSQVPLLQQLRPVRSFALAAERLLDLHDDELA